MLTENAGRELNASRFSYLRRGQGADVAVASENIRKIFPVTGRALRMR